MTLAEGRSLFPVLERLAYLNAGYVGPLARPTAAAVQEQLDADLVDGPLRQGVLRADARRCASETRAALAGFLGAEAAQVSLTASTTDGCNIVLAGLDLGRRTRS